jgi:AraC-like DNA-binding protein
VDDCEYEVDPGHILFVNSRVPHYTLSPDGETHYILLQFRMGGMSSGDLPDYLRFLAAFEEVPVRVIQSQGVADSIQTILEEYENPKKGGDFMIRSEIYRIAGCLIRMELLTYPEKSPDRASLEKVMPALDFIEENYASPITLQQLSDRMGLNPSYFCRLFRSATGATFTEYLNFVRVSKSEQLLRQGKKSITEVSMDVGFSSVSYYNRVFKRFKNCTPTVYRMIRYSNV